MQHKSKPAEALEVSYESAYLTVPQYILNNFIHAMTALGTINKQTSKHLTLELRASECHTVNSLLCCYPMTDNNKARLLLFITLNQ